MARGPGVGPARSSSKSGIAEITGGRLRAVEGQTEASQALFTADEQAEISRRLDEIKQLVREKFELTERAVGCNRAAP